MDLERYLIASLLIDPDSIQIVKEILMPDHFLDHDCKILYQKIIELDESGDDIDRFSLFMSGVMPKERLNKILSIEKEGVIFEAERFARFILQRHLENDFLETAQKKDPERGKEVIENLLTIHKAPEWMAITQIGDEEDLGIHFQTGFKFDDYVEMRQSDLCIIAGRTAIGKSTIGMNILQEIAHEHPVGLISFEMGRAGIKARVQMSISKNELEVIGERYFVAFPSSFNLATVHKITKDMIIKKDVKAIMIDYLQLMNETKKFSSRPYEVSYIVRQLKRMAKELNVLVILVSQLSRSLDQRGEKARPVLGDLKETGDIEYAADEIFFLHREDDNKRETELIIAKNRYGKKAVCDLIFIPEKARYGNASIRYDGDAT